MKIMDGLFSATITLLLLFEITVHPPDSTFSGGEGAARSTSTTTTSTSKLAGSDTNSSFGGDESLVELFGQWARIELSQKILGTETGDTGFLGFGLETSLLGFVGADALVDLLESETSLADLRMLITTSHGALAELGGVAAVTVLVEEVFEEGDTTIKVDVDLFTELGLTLESSHHFGLGASILGIGPLSVLGVLNKVAELLVEVETNVEIEIVTLIILEDQGDNLAMHISILDDFPCNSEDELGLVTNLGPVGVQEVNGLLGERLVANLIEIGKSLRRKFLDKRCHIC
jgi:hypothetical protein